MEHDTTEQGEGPERAASLAPGADTQQRAGSEQAARTPLYALHRALGARMVTFAGHALPLQYGDGIIKEHLHTRAHAGLFDVSHMGQVRVAGGEAAAALESVAPVDVVDLPRGRQRYTFLTNDAGGVIDDLMIANEGDAYLLVVNAAGKAQVLAWLRERLAGRCEVTLLEDRALLALQGPDAAEVLSPLAPAAGALAFMQTAVLEVGGIECRVSRSGYTGEDGFELSVAVNEAESLARRLLERPGVRPVGLGARDSLRLEAGLSLYGQDLDATTTPVEANLVWALSRTRRPGGARQGGYPGARHIEQQLQQGAPRRRVGLAPESRMPVRAGCRLVDEDGEVVGVVTSGGFGPSLGAPVAMGYVSPRCEGVGTTLDAIVRGKPAGVRVAGLPFVPHRYQRGG